MIHTFHGVDDVLASGGTQLGHTDGLEITQEQVNTFADATGDHQWIHVDVERANRESPFGGPIAHGYLTLSLIPAMTFEVVPSDEDAKMGVNYGLDKVRFPAPVPVGSRVRARQKLIAADLKNPNTIQVKREVTVEREGSDKPVCIAETLMRMMYG